MTWRAAGPRLAEAGALVLLVAVSLAAVRDHQRGDSATADEGIHVYSAAEYVRNGTYWINLEHPPLTKDLAGLALGSLGIAAPADVVSQGRPLLADYDEFLYLNRAPAHVLLDAARRPFPLLLALLVVVVWASARTLAGAWAGLLAAGLIALDPTFVAHAGIVHTDVAAALTMTAAFVLLLTAARRDSPMLWVATGLSLGIALATKFTAVLLVPFLGVVPLLALLAEGDRRSLRSALRKACGALAAGVVALGLLAAIYAVNLRGMAPGKATESVVAFLRRRGAPPEVVERQERISRAVPAIGHWTAGLEAVALMSGGERENVNFFHGRISRRGSPAYFPVSFAVKSTAAFLIALAAALVMGRRALAGYAVRGLFLMAAVLFAASIPSAFNIGVRHLLPLYPLLAIAGAAALGRRLPRRFFVPLSVSLVLANGVTLAAVHPLEFGYFNEVLGSPERGAAWFADSNVDWGQDMKRLGGYLRATATEATTTVVAYSGFATNYYSRSCRLLDPSRPIAPGRYAVSDSMQAIGPEFLEGLEGRAAADQLRDLLGRLRSRGHRVARVGSSITIWDLPG